MRLLFGPVSALWLLFGLAACVQPPESNFPELTFEHLPPLTFDVAAIEVEQAYQPKAEPPNVELLFPVRPGDAAANWGRDRLRAGGAMKRLRYIVSEASVIEVPLKTKGGITGAVTVEQSERYEARLAVDVEILDDGQAIGNANVTVARSITVPEDATLHEREVTWYQLTEKLMADMNARLEATLKKVFFRFLR